MFLAVGYEVKRLERVRQGTLRLGSLRPGEWRYLEAREVAALMGKEAALKKGGALSRDGLASVPGDRRASRPRSQ